MSELANRHLIKHLNDTGLSMAEFERRAGLARGNCSAFLKHKNNIGRKLMQRLDAHVHWPAECWAEMEEIERLARARRIHVLRYRMSMSPQPWPVTVGKLKEQMPVYARAW